MEMRKFIHTATSDSNREAIKPLSSVELEDADDVQVEVIVRSSPCSATCGVGLTTQTMCCLNDSKKDMEESGRRTNRTSQVSKVCRVRKVKCLESWQCGLRTMTVTSGEKVELDCLGEVMEAMGYFSWRVLWRYAHGIITSDDTLFAHWKAPQLDKVILDPVREEDAGTYRCMVQDAKYRRVKRVYWGIRVLPTEVLNLDYEGTLTKWESTPNEQNQQNQTVSYRQDQWMILYMVLIPPSLAGAVAGLILGLCWAVRRRQQGGVVV
uniref:transmembrane protein 81 n=1 Tax=Solea senegalensis TaxID=28829 RepID=UPI001CD8746F|nr:transmembrane protein 81 [Solea senegalensis]